MPKLQLVSGKQAVKKFEQLGYKTTRQTGSHIRLWHFFDKNKKPLTIPDQLFVRAICQLKLEDLQIKEWGEYNYFFKL